MCRNVVPKYSSQNDSRPKVVCKTRCLLRWFWLLLLVVVIMVMYLLRLLLSARLHRSRLIRIYGGDAKAHLRQRLIVCCAKLAVRQGMRSQKKTSPEGKITGGPTAAHREIEVLRHAFTKAVAWGYIDRHPFKGEVRLEGTHPRDRYVEDWEVLECLALSSTRQKGSVLVIQAYIRLKIMTGMARSDLLRLTVLNLKDDGIHIQRHKTANSTGKRTIYEWTPELRAIIETVKSVRPAISSFLFCNRKGEGYINENTGESHGWDSMWQRFMDRVLKETKVETRFTEHDLRAKCASDAESLEHARALLSHADARTTDAIYRRRPERVKPLDGVD